MCMERLIQPSLILHVHHQLHTLVDIPRKPPRASSYGPKEREASSSGVTALQPQQPLPNTSVPSLGGRAGDLGLP